MKARKLYHTTNRGNLQSILKRGLLNECAKTPSGICLSSSLDAALEFAANFPDPVILEVSLPSGWHLDDDFVGEGQYISKRDIPPRFLRVHFDSGAVG